ncbi:MAG TPA: F0F1 ATP synthase subunit A [Bryobacteraceae bacterium]|nr:F0F1 ATP synthase subunit A [Bryobacteraceae bacterium]
MHLTPDQIVLWQWHWLHINMTMVYTWIVMLLLTVGSWLITRRLAGPHEPRSRWQNAAEVIVETIRNQIWQVCPRAREEHVAFIATLFLFIGVANVLDVVPGWHAPTGSLSTTAALASCVATAVPVFGIRGQGFMGYFRSYMKPSPILAPLHLLSETSRTVALALRLFGNIMSGSLMVGVLLAVVPFFFPIVMQVLGLLTGMIQAYIFSILATVYIAAALRTKEEGE